MKWKKLGLVFCPNREESWLHTHASNPTAEPLGGNLFRIYFSPRDLKNRSQIASLLVEIKNEKINIMKKSHELHLTHGKNGRFDDSGVTITSIIQKEEEKILYYLGWNLSRTIPFRNSIGAAISKNSNVSFLRISEAPIVDRNSIDPISLSYPYILRHYDIFKIWYGSCIEWNGGTTDGYEFSIKYAESSDGINWERNGKIAIHCMATEEDAIARPHVIHENECYKMWYSKKKGPFYRMGYAESDDGINWIRKDILSGIDVSDTGWDSEMICYPFVFDHDGERYMLYNGNGYGKTGFGLAILEQD